MEIIQRAKVSRSAMHHHFSKRAMPQRADQPEAVLLANDLAAAMHLGLLLNSPFIDNEAGKSGFAIALPG